MIHENENDENIKISDKNDQFEISSDENFEKKNENENEEKNS